VLAKLRTCLTYANVMATVAVFLALGGGAYAAARIGSAQIKDNSVASKDIKNNDIRSKDIRTGNVGSSDIKNNGVSGTDVLESSLGKVPSASSADSATTAGDAGKLGGLPPEGWVRRDCNSTNGQIKGVATVTGSSSYTTTFSSVPGYNCSGLSVEANHQSLGRYQVRFNGSPVTQAVATAVVTGFSADSIGITNNGPGLFTVYVLDPSGTGAFVDDGFTLIAP
jgi:hypothetical protein